MPIRIIRLLFQPKSGNENKKNEKIISHRLFFCQIKTILREFVEGHLQIANSQFRRLIYSFFWPQVSFITLLFFIIKILFAVTFFLQKWLFRLIHFQTKTSVFHLLVRGKWLLVILRVSRGKWVVFWAELEQYTTRVL